MPRFRRIIPSTCLALLLAAPGLPLAAAQSVPPSAALHIEPAEVVAGDPVRVRITGLRPGQVVTLRAQRYHEAREALYRSAATYQADADGQVDTAAHTPVAATWAGADPRGLFWSMTRHPDPPAEGSPWEEVHISADTDADGLADLHGVLRFNPGQEALVETPLGSDFPGAFLLRPPGAESLPAVIVLGGSEGGDRAARSMAPLLALRGYAVLGLPYYSPAWGDQPQQIPGLPRAFHEIPLERLAAARDWLRAREDIRGDRIGLWGVSKGAEFALAGASRIPGFAAVAAIVPSDVIWEGWGSGAPAGQSSSFSWDGLALPFVPYLGMGEEFAKGNRGQAVRLRLPHDAGRLANPGRVGPARIDVASIAAPVLVVGGDQDDVWDSGGMARNIEEVRRARGLDTVLIVDQEAGHGLSGHGYEPTGPAEARVQGAAFPALLQLFGDHLRAPPAN